MTDATPAHKVAANDHPILDILRRRWSGRALDERELPRATIASIFEAMRWAPSAGNSQPWRFMAFVREDPARADAEACLVASNGWAKRAPLLVIGTTKETNDKGEPSKWARHDLGLATENLLVQAVALGLVAHPMAGFSAEEVRKRFSVPDEFMPMTMIAIGYPGEVSTLDEKNQAREKEVRTRKPMGETVFAGGWNKPFVP